MKVVIDNNSGFCFGVIEAIKQAEAFLGKRGELFCLGDIVHNNYEINRLSQLGIKTITDREYRDLQGETVLLRAHGEPPTTYRYADANNITLLDATCPVVLKLQKRVKKAYIDGLNKSHTIIIYGKRGHAEVNGLVGQTEGNAIVIEDYNELKEIEIAGDIDLFSQTTKPQSGYKMVETELINIVGRERVNSHDTICKQVANRIPHLKEFSNQFDTIIFVGGEQSSNGKMLYNICLETNKNSFYVSSEDEIEEQWFNHSSSVGICGATSTPMHLMELISDRIREIKR